MKSSLLFVAFFFCAAVVVAGDLSPVRWNSRIGLKHLQQIEARWKEPDVLTKNIDWEWFHDKEKKRVSPRSCEDYENFTAVGSFFHRWLGSRKAIHFVLPEGALWKRFLNPAPAFNSEIMSP